MRLQFVTLSHSGFEKLCLANALAQGDSTEIAKENNEVSLGS
jgi:hypothetical protein